MTKYPETIIPGSGYGKFCIAFVFTEGGTKVYKGLFSSIAEALTRGPLSHTLVLEYSRKEIKSRKWTIVGSSPGCDIKLIHSNFFKLRGWARRYGELDFDPLKELGTRNVYVLLRRDSISGKWSLMGKWRRLPQQYLSELGGEKVLNRSW